MNITRVAAIVTATLLAGCAIGPDYKRPTLDTPTQYKEMSGAETPPPAPPPQWWTLLNDPVLNDLESRVEVSNQNLLAQEAAYRQALSVVRQQRAGLFPSVNADVGVTKSGGSRGGDTVVTAPGGGSISRTTSGKETYTGGASASWEIDLWGRLRRSLENAHALADASQNDLKFAKLSIQTQLATTYLQLREADAEQRLINDTVSAYERALQIAQNRYNVGMAVKSDVLQAQTQLANAQEQASELVLTRAQAEHAIAALVGVPPAAFALEVKSDWRTDVLPVPSGIPSTLLERRPDIASSERRVKAANANIGVEEAAYFPSLTLNGSYSFLSSSLDSLFKSANAVHSVGASLAETVFDAGRTPARVAGARAAYDQSVAEYRQTVLTAFQDVEDQLAASTQLTRQYELRRQASEAADETERLTLNQYRAGTVSYTNVVVAQTTALSARQALARVELQRQTTAIALIKALGGDWGPPAP
ncbi:MAG: efflux transporter outer membrane subunit [Gammaproteobacteria bacterium]